ncbi:MAG: hypothetical protein IKH26_13185 [Bacteroidaceae bacterium]|nr:hypothetical protein [Bacteroidaceae bacterium]
MRFAWGEIAPKDEYELDNYDWYEDGEVMDIGNERPDGTRDIRGSFVYDAATAVMGEDWVMPSESDFYELTNECTYSFTLSNGVYGYTFTGPNGNTLFLPVCTSFTFDESQGAGCISGYWTGTSHLPYPAGPKADAYWFHMPKNFIPYSSAIESLKDNRYYGNYIRAVAK